MRRELPKPGPVARAVDAIVATFNPDAAIRRRGARAKLWLLENRLSAYSGASSSAWEGRRSVTRGSADSDLDEATLDTLRARSRELQRNAPAARAMTLALADNIVGSGLRPRLALPWRQLGITRERAQDLAMQANRVWRRWNAHADATNRKSFLELQHLAVASTIVSGDCFAIPMFVEDARRPCRYRLKLELVESDRCDTPRGKLPNDREVRNGVELGARSQPVAYWFHVRHPGERWRAASPGDRRMKRYAADRPDGRPNVIHVYDQERIGQSRGVPALASTLEHWRHIEDYTLAEIEAASVASLIAGFVTSQNPESTQEARAIVDAISGVQGKRNRDAATRTIEEIRSGTIEYLGPGEDIRFSTPGRPSPNFGPFLQTMLHLAASALGMSYPIATRDFAGTNYSQARADILEAGRMFQRRQQWLATHFCQPVWKLLLEEAWLLGDFDAPRGFQDDLELWTATQWVPPGRGWVDPQKEVGAWQTAIELGVMDRSEVIAGVSGRDVEDVTEQLAYEAELRREAMGADAEPKPPADPADDGDSDADSPSEDEPADDGEQDTETDDE